MILKRATFKSYEWANCPVIGENMFREYDLRNSMIPLRKGEMTVEAAINTEGMFCLGQAYGTYVQRTLKEKRIVVGCDYRSYSRGNAFSFIAGVLSSGIDIVDIGVVTTPILYFSQYHFKLPGAAMITASHNENGWTGLKLAKGLSQTFEPVDIKAYKDLVYSEKYSSGAGHYERYNKIAEDYFSDIISLIKKRLGKRKLRVVVSGANGGGGYFMVQLVKRLGFEPIPYENELDWDFSRYTPNPENVKFAQSLGDAVRAAKADVGIAVDGDGDRFGVVDEQGHLIFSDRAGLFIARYLVGQVGKGQKIVIDVKSTGAYAQDTVLSGNGAKIIFAPTGHSYVKAATRREDALAGFEKSGHFFMCKDFGHGYDDGCLSAAWFITIMTNMREPLSALLAQQPKSYQSPTLEAATADDKVKYVIAEKVQKEFEGLTGKGASFAGQKIKELITINGVRFILENGDWGLIRASSNVPHLVMTAESFVSRRQMYDIVESIQKMLSKYKDVGEYDQQLPPYPGEDPIGKSGKS